VQLLAELEAGLVDDEVCVADVLVPLFLEEFSA